MVDLRQESTVPRALLITPTSPWTKSFGAQQRTALLYSAVAQYCPVDVLVIEEGPSNKVSPGERSEIIATLSWRQSPFTLYKYGINSWTNHWCHANIDFTKYDLVISREFTPITKVDWPSNLRTIVDCDDAYYRYAPSNGGLRHRLQASGRGWLRFHQTRAAMKRYSHMFFCSERDRELFNVESS